MNCICIILLALFVLAFSQEKCVKWGNTFDVPLQSRSVNLDCSLPNGNQVCCAATYQHSSVEDQFSHGVGDEFVPDPAWAKKVSGTIKDRILEIGKLESCSLVKEYFSSPHELRDLEMTLKIQQEESFEKRFEMLMDYVTSQQYITNSSLWLDRIQAHMQSEKGSNLFNSVDKEFLSRFDYLIKCKDREDVLLHREWIEPLTITARHPFSFGKCRSTSEYYRIKQENMRENPKTAYKIPRFPRSNVDYVLIQSGESLFVQNLIKYIWRTQTRGSQYRNTITRLALAIDNDHFDRYVASPNNKYGSKIREILTNITAIPVDQSLLHNSLLSHSVEKTRDTLTEIAPFHLSEGRVAGISSPSRRYFIDCGTSTFPSSMLWFSCAYSQRKISFDGIYAYELTLLEPQNYWSLVPHKWLPFWHFYNAPIGAPLTTSEMKLSAEYHHSPFNLMNQLSRSDSDHDFLSWKLDIDTPWVEMPLAIQLLNNPNIRQHVHEFFFELHFRCEVMTRCGWGQRVPESSHGLQLDRSHVIMFFLQLRRLGIRAHIWP